MFKEFLGNLRILSLRQFQNIKYGSSNSKNVYSFNDTNKNRNISKINHISCLLKINYLPVEFIFFIFFSSYSEKIFFNFRLILMQTVKDYNYSWNLIKLYRMNIIYIFITIKNRNF